MIKARIWLRAALAVVLVVAGVIIFLLYRQDSAPPLAQISSVVEGVAFSPDGQLIAFGTLREGTQIRRVQDGQLLQTLGQDRVNDVIFTPDGQLLITSGGGEGSEVQIWRVADGHLLQTLDPSLTKWVYSIALSPNGQEVAIATSKGVPIFRIPDGSHVRTLDTTGTSVAFSLDGQLLVVGANEPVVRVYRAETGAVLHTLDGHGLSVAVSPDSQRIAAPGWNNDTLVRLWNVADGTTIAQFQGHAGQIHGVAFSPDGQYLVSGANDGSVYLWRVQDGALLKRLQLRQGADDVAFSPDGRTVAIANWDTLRLWHIGDDSGK